MLINSEKWVPFLWAGFMALIFEVKAV